jgi:hypothetical protein
MAVCCFLIFTLCFNVLLETPIATGAYICTLPTLNTHTRQFIVINANSYVYKKDSFAFILNIIDFVCLRKLA